MNLFFHKNYSKCSDEELLHFAILGKEKAFDELYKRYAKKMLFFFYQRLYQDEPLANDFLQDLFLKVFENAQQFDLTKKFSTWIYTLASNMCKNEYRRIDYHQLFVDEEKNNNLNLLNEEECNLELYREILFTVLNEIDEQKRLIYSLKYFDNLTIKEISEIMDCSEGTVKSRLFYTSKLINERAETMLKLKTV